MLLKCQRHLFSLPDDTIYLSGASRSPLLNKTLKAGHNAMKLGSHPWKIEEQFDPSKKVKQLFASLVNAQVDDIALTPSCSYAISIAANALASSISEGQYILIVQDTFSSNTYPWQHLCKTTGAQLFVVPCPTDNDFTRAILQIDQKIWNSVRIVAVPNCLWTDGLMFDLLAIREKCDTVGAALVVDATQSIGVISLNVLSIRPDFLACSTHKWLFGGYGTCCLYVDKKYHKDPYIGLEQHEGTRITDHIFRLDSNIGYPEEHFYNAQRFGMGGNPHFILLPMLISGIEQVLEWKPENIAFTVRILTNRIATEARKLGYSVAPEHLRAPHIIGLYPGPTQNFNMETLAKWLKDHGVIVAARGRALRVSPNVYNQHFEIDRFLDLLKEFAAQQLELKSITKINKANL